MPFGSSLARPVVLLAAVPSYRPRPERRAPPRPTTAAVTSSSSRLPKRGEPPPAPARDDLHGDAERRAGVRCASPGGSTAAPARVRARVLHARGRRQMRRRRLGTRRAGRRSVNTWTPNWPRSALHAAPARDRPAARSCAAPLTPPAADAQITAPAPPPPPPHLLRLHAAERSLPVQGAYSFGGEGRALRRGRTGPHPPGQDIIAKEGTLVVTPVRDRSLARLPAAGAATTPRPR